MKMLIVENLSKSYSEKILFENLSFSITDHERIGLIGVNGTGKSTILKILAGIEQADRGEISTSKGYTINYLSQKIEFQPENTVLEQIFLSDSPKVQLLKEYEQTLLTLEGNPNDTDAQHQLLELQQKMDTMNAWDASSNAKAVLTKLGITDFNGKVGELSGGQKKRVALAQCLIDVPDLLILDEPTNHLDYETICWLEDYLFRYKGALLLVTHDRYFLDRVTNRIIELDQGRLYSYKGNYAAFLEGKAIREEQEINADIKRANLYRRELAWIRRGAKARTTKQKARIQRFEEIENTPSVIQKENVDIAISGSRLGKKVVELKNATKNFGLKQIINDFTFIIKPNDRIGIVGENGSGKSTLLNIITGKTQIDSGEIEIGQTVKFAYYTQENADINENQRIIEYIKETAEVIATTDGKIISAAQMLERFLFPKYMHGTPIRKLSGGEKRRLYLLKILMGEPNVLVLDEPTNDLDTQTLTILEDYLENFPGVVLTVSHDRYFLDKVVDHLLIFKGNTQIEQFYGAYTDYLEENKKSDIEKQEKPKELSNKQQNQQPNRQKRKLTYLEQKEWEEIEDKIAALENNLEEVTKKIENVGSDFVKAQSLQIESDEISNQLEKLIDRWTELSEIVEQL